MPSQATGDLRATIATNIRSARLAADLTQAQLAAVLGIESMAVSKWERGRHAPSDGNLLALAEHLRKPVSWFYTEHTRKAA
jgi:transcriptional regulator with XRE-family HTH domain